MKLRRQAAGEGTPAAGAWVGGLLLFGAVGAQVWLRLGLPLPGCGLRTSTGLACASCGTTRMVRALLSGDLVQAASWNPLGFLVLAATAVWSGYSMLRLGLGLPGWRLVLERGERRALWLLAIVALLAGWAYQIVRAI